MEIGIEPEACRRCHGCGTIDILHGTIDCPCCRGTGYQPHPKQVIIMRKDLGMSRGKLMAQASHASLKCILDTYVVFHDDNTMKSLPMPLDVMKWFQGSFTKIVLRVDSEDELMEIYDEVRKTDIPVALIKDAGRTELGKSEYTCLGIGPWNALEINKITGHLPLYK